METAGYSNTNYDLLAEVIKRVTGKPFSDWAWENIFRPLKMTRTQYRDNSRSIFDDEALSYNYTRQEYLRGIDNLSLTGSHSLFTSIADLSKWLVNLESGPADGQDIFSKMFTAGELDGGQESRQGEPRNPGSVCRRLPPWAATGHHHKPHGRPALLERSRAEIRPDHPLRDRIPP
jgi:CubicO group peptidase (beta-lactamase class C family)